MSQVVSFTGYTPAARYDTVAWSAVRVQEALTSVGPWSQIDEIALDPVDANPANPRIRNVTTEQASDTEGLWYRLVFVDSNGDTGQPSDPVQNLPPDAGSFATADDLANRLGLTFSAAERTRALELLAIASDLIRDAAGEQKITLVENDVLTIPGTNDERILLPQRPVVSVASVTLNGGELVEGRDWYREGNAIVRLRRGVTLLPSGLIDDGFTLPGFGSGGPWGVGFGAPWLTLQITYTHGYAAIPESVKAICMEAVVRVWVNPGAVAQERVGDTSTMYTSSVSAGLLLTDREQRIIRRLFGRTATSVTVGR